MGTRNNWSDAYIADEIITLKGKQTGARAKQIMFNDSNIISALLLGLLFNTEDGSDVPPKRRAISELYGVTTQKTEFFIKNDLKCDLAT